MLLTKSSWRTAPQWRFPLRHEHRQLACWTLCHRIQSIRFRNSTASRHSSIQPARNARSWKSARSMLLDLMPRRAHSPTSNRLIIASDFSSIDSAQRDTVFPSVLAKARQSPKRRSVPACSTDQVLPRSPQAMGRRAKPARAAPPIAWRKQTGVRNAALRARAATPMGPFTCWRRFSLRGEAPSNRHKQG